MIFGFWTDGTTPTSADTVPRTAEAAWQAAWPGYRVWRDPDVRPLLARWGDDAVALYDAIRIPACRSDVARLVLLHQHGGLYVDLHAAPGDPARLRTVIDRLVTAELVIFDESADRENDRHTWLMNGALAARPGSPALAAILRVALNQLRAHRAEERRAYDTHVAYSIFDLTGPAVIWHELFDRVPNGGALKPTYCDRVAIWPVDAAAPDQPLYFHRHAGFRPMMRHWSERQKIEPLFAP
jgi:mannosyltransferase OCH1-like enzyme